jgi:hypothetical protein
MTLKHRLLLFVLLFLIGSHSSLFAQKKKDVFQGQLTYRITICDTSLQKLVPENYMIVVTDDTLLRIENNTERFGRQTVIKHMSFNKSYLLFETPTKKYAVQTNHNTEKKDSSAYQFKRKWGKVKICGLKAKRLLVSHAEFPQELPFFYFKNLSPKYLNAFENFPGLPAIYYVASPDGIFLYELIDIKRDTPNHDLFGIPSDYKKVTFDDFLKEILEEQGNQGEIENEK